MKKWLYGILAVAVGFVLFSFAFIIVFWSVIAYVYAPSVRRLPFGASDPLTEEAAIDLTRRALIHDGKQSNGMRPVPYWHDHESVFAKRFRTE